MTIGWPDSPTLLRLGDGGVLKTSRTLSRSDAPRMSRTRQVIATDGHDHGCPKKVSASRTISGPNLRALSAIKSRVHFVFAGCPQGNVQCVI